MCEYQVMGVRSARTLVAWSHRLRHASTSSKACEALLRDNELVGEVRILLAQLEIDTLEVFSRHLTWLALRIYTLVSGTEGALNPPPAF